MTHEPGEPRTFQEPDHYSAPAAWAEVKAALREAEEQPQPQTPTAPSVTSSEVTLARMLVAYDAWEPLHEPWSDAMDIVSAAGDEFLGDGYLTTNSQSVFVHSDKALALIDRVRKAGML